ncbi:07339af2-1740-4074-a989-15bf51ec3537 [Sclerotinia trifoliorum]|uniref:07339af2-1740-4074-a989-15bf51ec3537 n=1 Tax=Sclerotinia trifoliorum TaxID=28548 RepID=A0A8H2W1G4_9HELO|nr:07339af2-1740-4074-a989-15bf51ec3537 [Sclerotinia trifoliorum]
MNTLINMRTTGKSPISPRSSGTLNCRRRKRCGGWADVPALFLPCYPRSTSLLPRIPQLHDLWVFSLNDLLHSKAPADLKILLFMLP